jgi:hypothetical protein
MQIKQYIPLYNDILPIEELNTIKYTGYQLLPFSDIIIEFLHKISTEIFNNSILKKEASFTSLAFWLRQSNIKRIIQENEHLIDNNKYSLNPLGIVYHVCPSNVDTMFIYSGVISLLCGNKNIIKISSRSITPELEELFKIINSILTIDEFKILNDYFRVVSYEHVRETNEYFSRIANARIIWGGDETVNLFKSYPTNTRCKDICFPNRISYSIFDSRDFLILNDFEKKKEVVKKFYNDYNLYDQKACSSPDTIFILGNDYNNKYFFEQFHTILDNIARKDYLNRTNLDYITTLKFNQLAEDAINNDVVNIMDDNIVTFVELNNIPKNHSCGAGYFYIKQIANLIQLQPYINNSVQTLSYFGLNDKMLQEIKQLSFGTGIDRVVPIGTALEFDYIWDGYNLFEELTSRKVLK